MKIVRNKKMKINQYEYGHMTNMAAMPYKVKPFKFFFFRTSRPIVMKLGMVCSNGDSNQS